MRVLVRRIAVLALVAALTAGCSKVPGVYVYEKDGQTAAAKAKAGGGADPKTYVADNWASRIVPTVHDKAVDVTTVAAAIAKDPAAAGRQYGHQSGTGSPFAYLVKGDGTVTDIDTSVPTGPMTVDVGGTKVTIATGPVIAGTAIRDAVGFIAFGDFTNQIDYAGVANQINSKVKSDVLAKVDVQAAKGKKATFYGAFSALSPGTMFVVPTELSLS
jgi:predicted lipoprotein